MTNGRLWLVAIVLLHLVLGSVYWAHTEYGVSPDERYHGLYVEHLAVDNRLPVFAEHGADDYEAHQPPLYYLLGVPFFLAAGGVGVRLLSLLLGALSVLVVYATIKTLLPDREHISIACAAFVALLPMHIALSSSVANDILMELVFGVALLLITGMIMGARVSSLASGLLGLVLGLGLLTKTTCILLFPGALLAYWLMVRRGTLTPGLAVRQVGIVLAVSLTIGGWWLVRNTVLYGDPLAVSVFNKAFADTAAPEFFMRIGWTGYLTIVAAWTFASFWGVFGHMRVFMPTWAYLGLAGVSIVALAAGVRPVRKLRESSAVRDTLTVYGVTAALVLITFVRFNLTFFQAQGRYLYPAIIPIALIGILGVERLITERNRKWSAAVVTGGMLLVTLIALFTAVIPVLPYEMPPSP